MDSPLQQSVAFCTLGCKTNLLESSALAQHFKALGWQVLDFDQAASLYVFNTCTVTEKADAESRRLIRKAKRQNPSARIAVTGCYAQVASAKIAEIEGVDFIIGNNFKEDLAQIVVEELPNYSADLFDGPYIKVDEFEKSRELVTPTGSFAGIERTRGSLKIQDGCDYKCTYCIIWKGRGPSRSLEPEAIVQRLQAMVNDGFKDISLTGINIGQYLHEGLELPGLLQKIIAEVQGEYRLRLTSLDPLEVTDKLIDVMAESKGKIAPHVHLSTQSADDGVLKAMARRHHVEDLKRICTQLVERIPEIHIASDVIVGFPTESDEAFERTMQVIEAIPMHSIHVFRYSPRPGTPAAEMKPQVPERIRKDRAQRLIALAEKKKAGFQQRFVGQRLQVLLERPQEDGSLEGISENYIRVRVSAEDVEAAKLCSNQLVSLKIVGSPGSETLTAIPVERSKKAHEPVSASV